MLKKSFCLFIVFAVITATLCSCNLFKEENTPKDVIAAYINGMAESDFDAVNNCYESNADIAKDFTLRQKKILKSVFSNTKFNVVKEDKKLLKDRLTVEISKPCYAEFLKEIYSFIPGAVRWGIAREEEIFGDSPDSLVNLMYQALENMDETNSDEYEVYKTRKIDVNFIRIKNRWHLADDNKEFFDLVLEDVKEENPVNTPEEAAEEFYKVLSENYCDQTKCYYYIDEFYVDYVEKERDMASLIFNGLDCKAVDCKINGAFAKVTMEATVIDYEKTLELYRQDLIDRGVSEDTSSEEFAKVFADCVNGKELVMKTGEFSVYCMLIDNKWYIEPLDGQMDFNCFVLGDDIYDGEFEDEME